MTARHDMSVERQLAEAREEIDALVRAKEGLTEVVERLEREISAASGGGWQPIETAPKDGTAVLLAGGCDDCPNFLLNHLGEFVRSPCRAMWDGDSWTMAYAEAGYVSVEYVDPTHWQPLPSPPQGINKPEFPDGLKSVLRSG